jgi:glycosyltransferase involved in cell wall biosynthesis
VELGWREEDTVAIPNGIDETRFESRASLPASEGLHLGCVARLTKDKGVDLLLRAVAEIPEARLTIIGDGPEERSIRKLIRKLNLDNRVTLRPMHDDLGAFYRSLTALILPSREHDPFGLVAAEAMSLGVPVIVTDACGIAEYLRDGEDAVIVRAGNHGALRQAILRLSEPALVTRLETGAPQTVAEKFFLRAMVDRYEALLRR